MVTGSVVYENPVSSLRASPGRGGLGTVVGATNVGWRVSGEGNDPVISCEGFTERGVASRHIVGVGRLPSVGPAVRCR